MADPAVPPRIAGSHERRAGHAVWVRVCHWVAAVSLLTLATTGFVILMAHPRLYWGKAGNDLMPALLELPISNNHRPEGWQRTEVFTELASAPISANRTYEIFNQNGWGRSLHFLAGWLLVVTGAIYIAAGLVTRHVFRDLLPRGRDLKLRALLQDIRGHLRMQLGSAGAGAPYGPLQKWAYATVTFVAVPLMVVTGLAMSPAVTAAHPILLDLFGGQQSARTVHFFGFAALLLFVIVHVTMVAMTGARRQLRAMTVGNRHER